jgi:ribonuclease BN (tRNA processing enzyme)
VLRLTVLGSSSSIPRPNRACSSYLVQSRLAAVVLDIGSGAFANLRQLVDYNRLDALVITHMHADHFLDLIPLRYALKYGSLRRHGKLDVFLPPTGEKMLRRLVSAFGRENGDADFLDQVFALHAYDDRRPLEIKDLRLTFSKAVHFVEAYAIRAQVNRTSITYSADTAPCDQLVELAHQTNLFLCESTLGPYDTETEPRGHCSAREAAQMGERSGAASLLLTHYGSGIPPETLAEEARRHFTGECGVADDFLQMVVG